MIVPKGHRILVEIPEIEERTAGGLIKPKTTQDNEKYCSYIARVISKGPTAGNCFKDGDPENVGLDDVDNGDEIVFCKYAGVDVEDPDTGIEYRIINDEDVLAVIK